MVNIVICDDNVAHSHTLEKQVREFISTQKGIQLQLALTTSNFQDVLNYFTQEHETTVYLLDIELNQELNGVQVWNHIHKMDASAYVIYVTAYTEYALSGCQSHAFDYIVKPYTKGRLESCLADVVRQIEQKKPTSPIDVKVGSCVYMLDQKDILYIKSEREYVTAFLSRGKLTWKESLTHLLTRLDAKQFVRIHKSYILAFRFVRQIDIAKKYVTLPSGEQLPTSRFYLNDFKKRLVNKEVRAQ